MKNLRDQLLKAGLVSKKDTRRAASEQLAERKQAGVKHSQAQEEADRKRAELLEKQKSEQKARDLELEAARAAERQARDSQYRLRDVIEGTAIKLRSGDRRWYYVSPDGTIRYLGVQDAAARELEIGELAIAALPQPQGEPLQWRVVPRSTANRLSAEAPQSLLFFAGTNPIGMV